MFLEPAPASTKLDTTVEVEPDEGEFEVETILDSRTTKGRLEYLVKWENYGHEDDKWEPLRRLEKNCSQELMKFHQRNPDRPAGPGQAASRRARGRPRKVRRWESLQFP